jgi:hypothetical protein
MSHSDAKKYQLDFFNKSKKAIGGQIKVEVDGVEHTFPVSRAEVRANEVVFDFDMSGGDPSFNRFIGVVIKKTLLNQKVEFVGEGEPVYFLFQNSEQEWVAESGWIRVEWQEGSKNITGLLDNVQSHREENSKLTRGKFEITLA